MNTTILFPLGKTVMTQGIAAMAEKNPQVYVELTNCLRNHQTGDYGLMCDEDKAANDEGLNPETPDRIMSKYQIGNDIIWIITEWDRSVTTILFPSEY